jgi:UDP-N-acetylglucosamine acyltransferase
MPQVHPSAILDGEITLADDVTIGPGCVLNGPVAIASGTRLIGNVYLQGPIQLGADNVVYPFTCLGFAPQHAKYDPATPGRGLRIGARNTFREHVTVHRAFTEEGPTTIGDRNFFMANSHVGHDAHIGSDCTFVNAALVAGHVTIEDRVLMGGGSGVHQFCRVGTGAMFAGITATTNDVLPWFMHTANNICGAINIVGLRRSGFDKQQIDDVRWVYRLFCRSKLPLPKAIEELRQRSDSPIVADYLRFLELSKRPICTARGKSARATDVKAAADNTPAEEPRPA